MQSTDKYRYPKWVKPSQLLIGDLKYVDEGKDQATKFYWNGFSWLHESKAPLALKKKSDLRKKFVEGNEQVRKIGML